MLRGLLPRLVLVTALLLTTWSSPALAAERALPPPDADLDYQLGGPAEPDERVGIVVRDRTAAPAGRYDVCYVNAFQTQPDARRFWRARGRLVLREHGRPVVDGAWNEWLLDPRTPAKRQRLARIVGRWITRCAKDGYEAVELDNLDSFTRSRGMVPRRAALRYARLLVLRSHRAGLAVAQKNLAGFDGTRLGFDLAVAEECGRYRECGDYVDDYGDAVLAVEYRARDFRRTCRTVGDRLPVVLRDRALRPGGVRRWC